MSEYDREDCPICEPGTTWTGFPIPPYLDLILPEEHMEHMAVCQNQ